MISSTSANSEGISWAPNRPYPSSERPSSLNSGEPVDSVIFDARGVEPHPVVRTSRRRVAVSEPPVRSSAAGCDQPYVAVASMLPNPLGDGNLVPVAEGVHDRCDPCQVVATTGEPMPPAISLRRGLHHGDTVSVVGVRPLLAQFAKLHDSTALVIVGHPTGNLISGDGGNEHDGTEVEACFSEHILAAGWVPIAGKTPIRQPRCPSTSVGSPAVNSDRSRKPW